jgi:hypothetical protein
MMVGSAGAALAAEITQQEDGSMLTACVQVLNEKTADNTAILASDCSSGFSAYWNWGHHVISGIGTSNGLTACIAAQANRLVVLRYCNPTFPGAGEKWSFAEGEVKVLNGADAGLCLDSQGIYGPTKNAQLVVNFCSGSSSQKWIIK